MIDLLIIGAGPAGSAAAIRALQMRPGAHVVLADGATFPRDKVCGDGLSTAAVAELAALGAIDVLSGTQSITRATLVAGQATVAVAAPDVGYVIPRLVFDDRLRNVALRLGAEPKTLRVDSVRPDISGVTVNGMLARTVIAADGANSTVRKLFCGPYSQKSLAIAARGYSPEVTDGVTIELMDLAPPAYWWQFQRSDSPGANVGVGVSLEALRENHLRLPDMVRSRWPNARYVHAYRLPLSPRRPNPAVAERVLLAGDAAGLINPITGEGIAYALASGRYAAEAWAHAPDSPSTTYRALLRQRFAAHHRMTKLTWRLWRMTGMSGAERLLLAVERDPLLMNVLMGVGLGDRAVSLPEGLRLVKAILRG